MGEPKILFDETIVGLHRPWHQVPRGHYAVLIGERGESGPYNGTVRPVKASTTVALL